MAAYFRASVAGREGVEPYAAARAARETGVSIIGATEPATLVGLWIYLDGVNHRGVLTGWAFDANRPTERLTLEVLVDGRTVGTAVADQQRKDLASQGIGDGGHAFSFKLPPDCLGGGPRIVSCSAAPSEGRASGRASLSVVLPVPFQVDAPWRVNVKRGRPYASFYQLKHTIMSGTEPVPSDELTDILNKNPELIFYDAGFLERANRTGEAFMSFKDRLAARAVSPSTSGLIHSLNRKNYTKEYCAQRGLRTADVLLVTGDLEELRAFALPPRFVIKPENDSGHCTYVFSNGMNLLNRKPVTIAEIMTAVSVYKDGKPNARFIVEELLSQKSSGEEAVIPVDYKLHTFGGRVRVIHIDDRNVFSSRDSLFRQQGWFSTNWIPSPHKMRIVEEEAINFTPPDSLAEMIEIAEKIQLECGDYVRVDLYDTDEGVSLGEVTFFTHGGRGFTPFGDYTLAQAWHISQLPSKRS